MSDEEAAIRRRRLWFGAFAPFPGYVRWPAMLLSCAAAALIAWALVNLLVIVS